MLSAKNKDWLRMVVAGLIGAIVGIVATSFMNMYTHKKEQQFQWALQSIQVESTDKPAEFIDIKQLFDEVKNLSILDSNTIQKTATLIRNYPQCASTLSDECRIFLVKIIKITREQLGTGEVSESDIDAILKPKYKKAERAMQIIQSR